MPHHPQRGVTCIKGSNFFLANLPDPVLGSVSTKEENQTQPQVSQGVGGRPNLTQVRFKPLHFVPGFAPESAHRSEKSWSLVEPLFSKTEGTKAITIKKHEWWCCGTTDVNRLRGSQK